MTRQADDIFALAVSAALRDDRAALTTLFALDARLGAIVASTNAPLIGQLRLAWWRDALVRLDAAAAPAEPLLQALGASVLPRGISGASLAAMIDGWETIAVADPIDHAALTAYADARGAGLFDAARRAIDGDADQIAAAGRGWALADFSARSHDRAIADVAAAMARDQFGAAFVGRWPRRVRPLGLLALLAAFALRPEQTAHSRSRDLLSFMRFKLTGAR